MEREVFGNLAELNEDDKRFAELIRDGFGVDVSGPAPKEAQVRPESSSELPTFLPPAPVEHPTPVERPATTEPPTAGTEESFFDFDASFARADRTPDAFDAFHAPNPGPLGRPTSPLQWFALVCLVFSVTLLVLVLFGFELPANAVMADILVIIGSIALVWRAAPTRPAPYEDYDDGARL
jgi:hypothetical protein